jgi:hypothetical protein
MVYYYTDVSWRIGILSMVPLLAIRRTRWRKGNLHETKQGRDLVGRAGVAWLLLLLAGGVLHGNKKWSF